MNEIRKILVPTDFSTHADEAFRVAQSLAGAIGATLILFHIAQPPAVVAEGNKLMFPPSNGEAQNLWDRLQHLLPADPTVRVEHEVIVADKPSASDILAILDKQGCDMIVMGTHGASWLKSRLFGSVTEEVVRRAPCPVMVVKPPAHKATRPVFSTATEIQQGPKKTEPASAKGDALRPTRA